MGYYSDVTIRCGEGAFSRLKEVWEEDTHMRPTDIRHLDDEYYIQWLDIKWYQQFREVDRVESVLKELDSADTESNPELGYCMCIIGEEVTDIEYTYNTTDLWIDITRKAVIPLNGEQISP